MQIQWEDLQKRYDELGEQLTNASLDNNQRQQVQKEFSRLSSLLKMHTEITEFERQLADARAQAAQSHDAELALLFQEEIAEIDQHLKTAVQELEDVLYPGSPLDDRSVFLEIRAGAGGKEAALFVGDLLKMYTNYALEKNWRTSLESANTTELGGYREIVLFIKGKGVYGYLKHESGVHRVQRVPATETQGRIHTSTVTIAVMPEAEEVDVTINPADLRIDVYRSGGAGGQHVNTTDSAVRITHIPTGAVVACQDERSQHKNKAKAMKLLQSRILAAQVEKQHAQQSQQRKELIGSGDRSEKVRTYNYPQNRVTDHRAEISLNKLDMVMMGALDEIIQALRDFDRQERRKNAVI